ncbi:MAG: diguanylate cyclase, partial [Clostridiales bacterium]|nr:diguanylate cyclase [Clostridiales bacterium]
MLKGLYKKEFMRGAIVSIILSITITALIYYFASQAIISNLMEALTEIAVQGSKAVENELQGKLDIVETIAAGNTIIDPEIPLDTKLNKLKRDVERRNFFIIAITDMDGNSISTNGEKRYVGDREYFRLAVDGIKNISEPIISKEGGDLVISFAAPIIYKDEITGVLFSIENIEALSSVSDSITLGDYGRSYIVDGQGTVIAHKDRELVRGRLNIIGEWQDKSYDRSLYNFFVNITKSGKGGGHYLLDGSMVYAGYSKIKGTDWTFVISAPKSQIFKSINQIYFIIILILILLLIVFIIASVYTKYLRKSLEGEKAFSDIAVDTANLIILSIDNNGLIRDFNRYAEIKLGYDKSEIIGKVNLSDLVNEEYRDNYNRFSDYMSRKENIDSFEMPLLSKNKKYVHIFWNTSVVFDYDKYSINMVGIDLTERAELAKEIRNKHDELTNLYNELQKSEVTLKKQYDELLQNQDTIYNLAYFDSLTNLPNKMHLVNLFKKDIQGARNSFAMLLLDLDNFKYINDTLGHHVGDKLLVMVGNRIKELLRDDFWACRLGGDEFMILVKGFDSIQAIELYAEKLLMAIESGFYIEKMSVNISFSMGIAIYPEHGKDFNELMKSADTAMYIAKETGKRKYITYNHEMNNRLIKNMTLESCMRSGMESDEFLLYYQPQLEVQTGRVRGFEALLRWDSKVHGFLNAAEFIEVAETSGLILPLGQIVLIKACKFIKHLKDMNYSDLKIAVNISVLQLLQDDFVDMVVKILEENDLEPSCLELEITETLLIEFVDLNTDKIKKLGDMGISISLDDFGTGYSSLTYIREL